MVVAIFKLKIGLCQICFVGEAAALILRSTPTKSSLFFLQDQWKEKLIASRKSLHTCWKCYQHDCWSD